MRTDNIFPRLRDYSAIIPEAEVQPYEGYILLQNGTSIRLRGDGTGTSENGTDYTCVSRGVGEPEEGEYDEYEVIGWVNSSEVVYE